MVSPPELRTVSAAVVNRRIIRSALSSLGIRSLAFRHLNGRQRVLEKLFIHIYIYVGNLPSPLLLCPTNRDLTAKRHLHHRIWKRSPSCEGRFREGYFSKTSTAFLFDRDRLPTRDRREISATRKSRRTYKRDSHANGLNMSSLAIILLWFISFQFCEIEFTC